MDWSKGFSAQYYASIVDAGLTMQDLTTWKALGELLIGAISNPYVLGLVVVSVFNAITDPTTAGIKDSERAMTYSAPHVDEEEEESDVEQR